MPNSLHLTILFIFAVIVAGFGSTALARPEYALQQQTSCMGCHALPMGAGPRTVGGKVFGSRTFPPAKTSLSDLYYGDFRSEYYTPRDRASEKNNGLNLMVAAVSANIPITEREKGYVLRYIGTFDMGSLSSGSREQVLLWSKTGLESRLLPDHVLFGKFYTPFGLLTDEHRTYTRMQARTTIREFEQGALLAWDLPQNTHLDLGLTDGFQSAGASHAQDETYAALTNLRWISPYHILLGASYQYHHTQTKPPSPESYSFYGGVDLSWISKEYFNVVVTGEHVETHDWNGRNTYIPSFFSDNTTFNNGIARSQARGYYVQVKWDIFPLFTLTYKYDWLALDKRFPSDAFTRNGYGFIWQFDSNVSLMTRLEKASVGAPILKDIKTKAAEDLFWVMLRAWL